MRFLHLRYHHPAAVCVFLLGVLPGLAPAQTKVAKGVGAGGGGAATSTNFALRGTAGQPAVGRTQSDGYRQDLGYWYGFYAVVTAVGDRDRNPPAPFRLDQNYPNPFNPVTTIRFALPRRAHVTLSVYDAAGHQVSVLVDGVVDPGIHTAIFDSGTLASGIYFYRLQTAGFTQTRKLVVLK